FLGDGPEVDLADGRRDSVAGVLGAAVGAVELVAGPGDPLVGEALVDGVPVVGGDRVGVETARGGAERGGYVVAHVACRAGVGDDRVDVETARVVAERGGDVVAHVACGAGVGDVADEGPVARGGHVVCLVLGPELSDSAPGEAEFCGGAGLGAPRPLGGVPLHGTADDADAFLGDQGGNGGGDVGEHLQLLACGQSVDGAPVDLVVGHSGPPLSCSGVRGRRRRL